MIPPSSLPPTRRSTSDAIRVSIMPMLRTHYQQAVQVLAIAMTLAGCTGADAPTLDADAGVDASQIGCAAHAVTSVSGSIVEANNDTLGGARVQPCIIRGDGVWLCLAPTDSDETGHFERGFDGDNACMQKLAIRITGPVVEGIRYSTAYCQASLADNPAVGIGTAHLVRVSAPSNVTGTTAHYASGLELEIGAEDGEPSELLSSFDGASIGCGNIGTDALAIVSFAPEGILRDTRIKRVPLPSDVADGAMVGIYVLGGLATYRADGTRVDEGELDLVGMGAASGGELIVDLPLLYASTLVLRRI